MVNFFVVIAILSVEFALKDLESLSYFQEIVVTRYSGELFLSHRKYAFEIVERVDKCHPANNLPLQIETKNKLGTSSS